MVEGARLESVCAGNRTEGSNPFLSAIRQAHGKPFSTLYPICYNCPSRRDDRAVDGNGLENRRARKGTVGSNPTLSATLTFYIF